MRVGVRVSRLLWLGLACGRGSAESFGRKQGEAAPLADESCEKWDEPPHADRSLPTGFGQFEFDTELEMAYLPEADFYRCMQRTPSKAWTEDANEFQSQVDKLQSPPDCEKPFSQWFLVKFGDFGLGANIEHFAMAVTEYWSRGKGVLLSNAAWRWSDRKCGAGWSCYMADVSKCKLEALTDSALVFASNNMFPSKDMSRTLLKDACSDQQGGRYNYTSGLCDCDDGFYDDEMTCLPGKDAADAAKRRSRHGYNWWQNIPGAWDIGPWQNLGGGQTEDEPDWNLVPSNRRRNEQSRTWVRPHVMLRLFETAPYRAAVEKSVADLGLALHKRTIGVHIRHGDACNSEYKIAGSFERTCYPFEVYMAKVEELMETYGKDYEVFLATDDQEVIAKTASYPHIEFRHLPTDRSVYEKLGVGIIESQPEGSFDYDTAAKDVWRDLWALATCEILVGSFVSNLFQIALELGIARRGHFVPYVSLETSWLDPYLGGTWEQFKPGAARRGSPCQCDMAAGATEWHFCICNGTTASKSGNASHTKRKTDLR